MIEEIKEDKGFTEPGGKNVQVGPGWLKGADNDKYRRNILQAMMIAQNRYERRKLHSSGAHGEKSAQIEKLEKDYRGLVAGKYKDNFNSKNKHSIAELQRRQLFKKSSCMKKELERFFIVTDEEKFAYYGKSDSQKPKKQLDTNKFECKIEHKVNLTQTELKTWSKKEETKPIRVRIMVPKGKKKREVYYYTDDLFEAELVKLELQKHFHGNLKVPILTANEIFKANVTSNITQQIKLAPVRKSNWEKIAAVAENYPDNFAQLMHGFGQRLIDKAKLMIAPKNKWLFDFKNLKQGINNGRESNTTIKAGKMLVNQEGLHFLNDSKPRDNFTIGDYDEIHAILCQRQGKNYNVNIKGRKMNVLMEDTKDVQDPMEKLLISKANRSNFMKKNLLVITVKSINFGNFERLPRGGEAWVRIEWGNFYTRSSYMKEQNGKVNINETLVIDLDNSSKHMVTISVNTIQQNDLAQYEKDRLEYDELGSSDVEPGAWPSRTKHIKIDLFGEDEAETDISVNFDA